MHKKTNSSLSKKIEKGHVSIQDGIIINLDTGFIYGGAVDQELNNLAVELNKNLEIANINENPKHTYTFFQKLINFQTRKGSKSLNLSSSYRAE